MAKGSIKRRIQRIQRHLGMKADGLIGPATLTAIEEALFDDAVESIANDYALTLSRKGLKQLVNHEIGSAAYYRQALSHPIWPGGRSGVTIGIGYDLGYNSDNQIRKDWYSVLAEIDLERLVVVYGLKGPAARQAVNNVRSVTVPLESAREVFFKATLPRYALLTKKTYPGVENLHPDAQTALLSLIYNRGASFKGARRREMAAIKELVATADYEGIAQQIRAMKRLWEGSGLSGLLKRRDHEARLVRLSDREYETVELVRV
ncbi:hypothetical protein D3OALGB2SA_5566 [Olavius algarvensis associated proteobacterium Delta 3]|nr:hypothetical protein D3OALGB2SA_5566 [Olavius algarvensis associated proteobacterium Delta 3]